MIELTIQTTLKKNRQFIPESFKITNWESLKPYFELLKTQEINNVNDLENWLKNRSELESIVEEEHAWRYIRTTIDTTSKKYLEAFTFFIEMIEPEIAPYENSLNKKLNCCLFTKDLKQNKYFIYLRSIKKQIDLFNEKNIPLFTKESTISQNYNTITGSMSVEINGKDLTIQQASKLLEEQNRELRENVFRKISERKLKDSSALDNLFSQLTEIRQQIAQNAGYTNYRDYKHHALGRFDYSVNDCYSFHNAIKNQILPLTMEMAEQRKKALGLESLKPWDMEVDPTGKPPLSPFNGSEELINKSITCFNNIDPYLGECLSIMKEIKHLDLESRKGKAPGGYNYPLAETGIPFIFMNSANSLKDVVTMVHEGGHAAHSFLSKDLELNGFKNLPSEVAELASMSMELITMEHWGVFFNDRNELKRAKRDQLEKILKILPWIVTVDRFQHEIYCNLPQTSNARREIWKKIFNEYFGNFIDWNGFEESFATRWHSQLHIFEIPFYYIEYGFAQLGAIAVWKNYKENPESALKQYKEALKLGYTKTIGEIYKTAGIRFDFSEKYVKELADFIRTELEKID